MREQQHDRRELEARYHELQREVERRGGVSREFQNDVVPLEVKVQYLESVLRFDDQINGKR